MNLIGHRRWSLLGLSSPSMLVLNPSSFPTCCASFLPPCLLLPVSSSKTTEEEWFGFHLRGDHHGHEVRGTGRNMKKGGSNKQEPRTLFSHAVLTPQHPSHVLPPCYKCSQPCVPWTSHHVHTVVPRHQIYGNTCFWSLHWQKRNTAPCRRLSC